jgi:hypothetical protein
MQKYKNEESTINKKKKKIVNKVAKEIKEIQRQMIESRSKNLGKKCQKLRYNIPHHSLSLTHTNTPRTMHTPLSLSLSVKEVTDSPPPTSNKEEETKECKTNRMNWGGTRM